MNHLKSKSSCPAAGDADAPGNVDAGDGQGCWNALRVAQAEQLRRFVSQLPDRAAAAHDVLIVGDLNAYAKEDPVFQFTGSGYVDELGRFAGVRLLLRLRRRRGPARPRARAAPRLSPKVTGAAALACQRRRVARRTTTTSSSSSRPAPACAPDPYAPTAFRSSDHDPVLVGLSLVKTITAAPTRDHRRRHAGRRSDRQRRWPAHAERRRRQRHLRHSRPASPGARRSPTSRPASTSSRWPPCCPACGCRPPTRSARATCRCTASGSDAVLSLDPDAAGPAAARPMVLVKNLGCAELLKPANFIF
ncbi:MAG: hypothetical protein MZW92_29595 [Comamonadaceae bacterium]|nr:hypothetical protein [Comamonadaceae bacterium]